MMSAKKKAQKTSIKVKIANYVTGLGYMGTAFTAVLLVSILSIAVADSLFGGSVTVWLDQTQRIAGESTVSAGPGLGALSSIASYGIAGVIVVLAVAIYLYLPYLFGRAGNVVSRGLLRLFHIEQSPLHLQVVKQGVNLIIYAVLSMVIVFLQFYYGYELLIFSGMITIITAVFFMASFVYSVAAKLTSSSLW